MTAKKPAAERPTAQDLANRDERDAAYAAEQKPDTSERAKKLTMGQTPKTED